MAVWACGTLDSVTAWAALVVLVCIWWTLGGALGALGCTGGQTHRQHDSRAGRTARQRDSGTGADSVNGSNSNSTGQVKGQSNLSPYVYKSYNTITLIDCPWRNFCSFVKSLCEWWSQSVLTRKIRFMKRHKKVPYSGE